MAVCAFRVFPNRDVTVLSDGQTYQVAATFDARSQALSSANIEPGDVVRYSEANSHSSIAVERAQPVQIEADGVITSMRTQATTIEGALAEAGVPLQPGDRIYLDGRLTTGRGPLAASVAASRKFIIENPNAAGSAQPTVQVAIVRARPITLVVDEMRVDSRSSAPTVQAFLAELGLIVREGDLVQPALDAPLSAGVTVNLKKGRTVSVIIDGKEQSVYTLAPTVADLFRVLGVTLGPEDVISLDPATPVTNHLSVTLGRTIITDEEVIEPISPPVQYEQDSSMAFGTARTIPGAAGEQKVMYRVTYKAGQVVSREALPGGEIVVQPVPTRIIQGTKGGSKPPVAVTAPTAPPASAASTAPTSSGRTVTVWATWYNESHGGKDPGDWGYGITKSGKRLDYGICATDPNYIPLGTWFYVPGYGNCLAADIGGGIRGWHIDLGFPEAYGDPGWGAKYAEITIFD